VQTSVPNMCSLQDDDEWTLAGGPFPDTSDDHGYNNWYYNNYLGAVGNDRFPSILECLDSRQLEHDRRKEETCRLQGTGQTASRRPWCQCLGGVPNCVLLEVIDGVTIAEVEISDLQPEEDDWTLLGGPFPNPLEKQEYDAWFFSKYIGAVSDNRFSNILECLDARKMEHDRRVEERQQRGHGGRRINCHKWCQCIGGARNCVLIDVVLGSFAARVRGATTKSKEPAESQVQGSMGNLEPVPFDFDMEWSVGGALLEDNMERSRDSGMDQLVITGSNSRFTTTWENDCARNGDGMEESDTATINSTSTSAGESGKQTGTTSPTSPDMNDESNSTSTTSGSERKMNSISGTSDTNDGSDTASTNTGFTTTGGNYRDVNFSDGMRDTMDDSDTATVNSSSTSSGENGQESQSIASYGADTNTPLAPTPRLITQTASTLTLTGHRKSPRYFQDTASSASPPSQSIRENARNRSESTGRQTSANSYYNVAYARSRRSHHSHEDQQVAGPLTQLNYLEMRPEQGARSPQGQPGFPEPQASETEEEDQPGDDLNDGQPTHQDDSRVCFCDNLPMPLECTECNPTSNLPVPCAKHNLVFCSRCNAPFHAKCIADYQLTTIHDIQVYTCMSCTTTTDGPDVSYQDIHAHSRNRLRNHRLGLPYPEEMPQRRAIDHRRTALIPQLASLTTTDVFNAITGNVPRAYTTSVNLLPEVMQNHVTQGRRFELSMLLFTVGQCSCCGRVQPGNIDERDNRKYEPPFEQKALINICKPAWHCSCRDFCKGSQFYAQLNKKQLQVYQTHHDGKSPWEVMGLPQDQPNALLCSKCHAFPDGKNTEEYLHYHRKFSLMNGFGPIHVPPPYTPREDVHYARSRELTTLLNSFTSAEEAAIRQIAPLVQITRLNMGNIGMKGNTACIQVQSSLNRIIPNLSRECKIIILTRSNGARGLVSTQFTRGRIQRALELLKGTGHPAWQIDIDPDRLSQWPEEGDLTDPGMGLTIRLDQETGEGQDVTPTPSELPPQQGNNDLGDEGPAQLQFADEGPEEGFEGLMCLADEHGARGAETEIVDQVVRRQVHRIHALEHPVQLGIPVHIDGNVATMAEQDVLGTGEFVNMNTSDYAHAKAWPTLFIPWFGPLGGNAVEGFVGVGWHITHNYKRLVSTPS